MMWSHYDSFSWWWFVIMPLGMLGFWALVGWVVVTLLRGDRTTPPPSAPSTEAERILAERYARGDIDTTDYHARLDNLRRTGATSGGAP